MYSKSDYLESKNKQEHLLIIATKYQIKFDDEYSIKTLKSINEIKNLILEKICNRKCIF